MDKIRVVVFGQQAAFQKNIKTLQPYPDIDFLIITLDPHRLLQAILQYDPHIALIEVTPESDEAISLIDQIHFINSPTKCIVLAHELDELHVRQAVNAGVMGYFLYQQGLDKLIAPIRLTHSGKFTCSAQVAALFMQPNKTSTYPAG